jgi:cytochrome b pre-mRNA-processing protein 3
MFRRLFGSKSRINRSITDALYAEIVAAARQPVLYSNWNSPDTPLGRFEMLALHMFLFQHRMRDETGPRREIAQILIDEFFSDVEHSLRELGIGDMGVPKRMKKFGRMFYGRTAAYADALERDDREALAAALSRNIRPDSKDEWPESVDLAAYVIEADKALLAQDVSAIEAGKIRFPDASNV